MLTDTVRMLMRRWLLCVLVVVLAAAAGIGAFIVVKPIQESKAQVLLVGAVTQPGVAGPTNPLLNLGGSLAIVPSLVQVKVSDDTVAQALYNQGETAKYKVEQNLAENAGPTLIVTADDKDGTVAQQTMLAVIDEIKSQLAALQATQNVNSKLLITATVLTQSTHPLPVRKGQVQKAILGGLGVLVIGLLLVLLLERRRPSGPQESETPIKATKPAERPVSDQTQAGRRKRPEPRQAGDRPSDVDDPAYDPRQPVAADDDSAGTSNRDRRNAERREAAERRAATRSDESGAVGRAGRSGRSDSGRSGEAGRSGSGRPGRRANRDDEASDSSILPGGMPEGAPDPVRR